jgi:hypothetical protein
VTRRSWTATLTLAALCLGCAPDRIPDGVSCAEIHEVGARNPDVLAARLAEAAAGDCVVVEEGEYGGAFNVPSGVKLIGAGTATFRGEDTDAPAVLLRGGVGSGLYGVRVLDAEGEGIRVLGAPAELRDVEVSGARGGALMITCEGPCADELVEVTRAVLRSSRFGLWAHGTRVVATDGVSSEHDSAALTSGYGVIASAGADLTLAGFRAQGNTQVGVLVDGAGGTRAVLRDVNVSGNEGRGVFAQGLRGTADEPALRLEGVDTLLEGNGVMGLGAVDSLGIIFVNGRVADTVARPIPTDLGTLEEVGDGICLFDATGEVRLEGVELSGSARAQLIVDSGLAGIIFVNGRMEGQLKAVVQNTAVEVELPADLLSGLSAPLGIQAEPLELPAGLF